MQARFVGFPCKGTSGRSGQPWHAGEKEQTLAQVQALALGLALVEAGDGVCKDKTHACAGQRANGSRASPPQATYCRHPACSTQQPHAPCTRCSLHSLLAGSSSHSAARRLACLHRLARGSAAHAHKNHIPAPGAASPRPHTPRPASGIIHTSSSEHLRHRRHTSQLVARTVCTVSRMHPFEHVPGSVPLFWSFLSHTPRPPHPPDWPLPRCHKQPR
jgi:hypothetical protein